ncbi:MAG: hypothetical protein JSS61_03675 [Verrucomicrobia bacterium]|nr:hypothetical protein [Verrucomicrobiota bacterium]
MRYLLILLLALSSCKKTTHKQVSDDFESLTGKDLPTWQYVQTPEDLAHLAFYKRLYDLRKGLLSTVSNEERIPHVLHFIWLGPKPFPRESVENVRTWIAKHPGWTVNFWTDRQRPLPYPGMRLRMLSELSFTKLKSCFDLADNYGEKSDLLRYEILLQEGGIYVDHDVKCLQSLNPLHSAYDFYCSIDMPYTSSLPSCIYTTNNLIGVRPGHPILQRCIDLIAAKWHEIGEQYPGQDRDATLNRVLHRTFWLFGEAVKEVNNQGENRDIVFPAYHFNAPKEELGLYARHQYAGTWHETESPFEKMVRQRLMLLSKKSNKTLLFVGILSTLNLIGFGFLFYQMKRRRTA